MNSIVEHNNIVMNNLAVTNLMHDFEKRKPGIMLKSLCDLAGQVASKYITRKLLHTLPRETWQYILWPISNQKQLMLTSIDTCHTEPFYRDSMIVEHERFCCYYATKEKHIVHHTKTITKGDILMKDLATPLVGTDYFYADLYSTTDYNKIGSYVTIIDRINGNAINDHDPEYYYY